MHGSFSAYERTFRHARPSSGMCLMAHDRGGTPTVEELRALRTTIPRYADVPITTLRRDAAKAPDLFLGRFATPRALAMQQRGAALGLRLALQ